MLKISPMHSLWRLFSAGDHFSNWRQGRGESRRGESGCDVSTNVVYTCDIGSRRDKAYVAYACHTCCSRAYACHTSAIRFFLFFYFFFFPGCRSTLTFFSGMNTGNSHFYLILLEKIYLAIYPDAVYIWK